MNEPCVKRETRQATNVTLRPALKEAAARFAFQKEMSLSELIEKALTRELKKVGVIPRRQKGAK